MNNLDDVDIDVVVIKECRKANPNYCFGGNF